MPPIVSMCGPKTPKAEPQETNQNIQVFVRCRPLKQNEKRNVVDVVSERREVRINERSTGLIAEKFTTKTFTFDQTFGPDTPQIDVYKSVVAPLIDQVVMGYNCTVFAYGQTGTGKTYTMEGERTNDQSSCSWEDDPLCGIIPRALHQLFETLQSQSCEHTVRVSFLELYNEELYDLLSAIDDTTKLKIYDDASRKGSTIVSGLEEITVHTKAEIYDILKKGSAKRQTAATLLNACSSRSHTIFSVTIHIKENSIDGEELVKIGKLNLVDLAGSENIGRSGAIDKRAKEAGNINQSLLTLGRVITCLVEKAPHIPYRESKLTRLLQDSLGGRTKTSIIATISPSIADVEDTLSTLDYAHRAKKIMNKPEINQRLSKKTLLKEYTAEIERLRRDLAACREKNGIYINQDNYNMMEEKITTQSQEIEEKCAQIQALKDEIEKINSLFEETKTQLQTKSNLLQETTTILDTTSKKLSLTEKSLNHVTQDRDQQKYLVQVHSENEKILTNQAQQLLTVADQSTNHVQLLHDKVQRQSNVVETNEEKIQNFQEKFRNEITQLEEWIDMTTSFYNDSLNEMQTCIIEKINSITKVAGDLVSSAEQMESIFNDQHENVSKLNGKDKIVLENAITLRDNSDKVGEKLNLQKNQTNSMLNNAQDKLQKQIQTLMLIATEQRTAIEELVMRQNTKITNMAEIRVSVFNNVKSNLETIYEQQRNDLVFFKNELDRITNEKAQYKQSMNQKWDQLEKLLSDIKVEQIREDNAFVKSSSNVITKMDDVLNNNETQFKNLVNQVDDFTEKLDSEEKLAIKFNDEIDELSTKNTQNMINECQATSQMDGELKSEITKDLEIRSEELLNILNEGNQINNGMIRIIDKQINDKELALKQMNDMMATQFNNNKEFMENIKSHLNETSDLMITKTDEMKNQTTTCKSSQIRQIENNYQDFEHFVKYELKKVIPTGATPQKTEFAYPRSLVQTSPHERILRRYKMAIDPTEALIAPLPEESDSELLSYTSDSKSLSSASLVSTFSEIINNENVPIIKEQETTTMNNSKIKSNSTSDLKKFESDKKLAKSKKSKIQKSSRSKEHIPFKVTNNN